MRYIHIICIGLSILLLGASAQAEELRFDGNELLSDCDSEIGTGPSMWCTGYIDGLTSLEGLNKQFPDTARWCAPPGVTLDQARRVIVKYLHGHPEQLHRPQVTLTYIALLEAFPCPKPSAPK